MEQRFRAWLVKVADDLSDQELKHLEFLLLANSGRFLSLDKEGILNGSKRAYNLFRKMEQNGYLSPQIPSLLKSMLETIGRTDLSQMYEDTSIIGLKLSLLTVKLYKIIDDFEDSKVEALKFFFKLPHGTTVHDAFDIALHVLRREGYLELIDGLKSLGTPVAFRASLGFWALYDYHKLKKELEFYRLKFQKDGNHQKAASSYDKVYQEITRAREQAEKDNSVISETLLTSMAVAENCIGELPAFHRYVDEYRCASHAQLKDPKQMEKMKRSLLLKGDYLEKTYSEAQVTVKNFQSLHSNVIDNIVTGLNTLKEANSTKTLSEGSDLEAKLVSVSYPSPSEDDAPPSKKIKKQSNQDVALEEITLLGTKVQERLTREVEVFNSLIDTLNELALCLKGAKAELLL